jgi:hypothetical protein
MAGLSETAQDKIIAALVNAAFVEEDSKNGDVAEEIRSEATKLAKRWGISEVPGLPRTWKPTKRVPSYD